MAVIASTDPFTTEVFKANPNLRVIARTGVGIDAIDLTAATASGVAVVTSPGAVEETVADHVLALLLSLIRRLDEHDASVRAGRWDRAGALTPGDLSGAVVGLIGSGVIGRAVIRRLRAFGSTIMVSDPALTVSPAGTEVVELEELLVRSDAVSLQVPYLPTTRNLIGEAELKLMKSTAVLVNTSRGGIVDEGALAAALQAGQIAAAGIDVFETEPPADSPLLGIPNVILTPHVAGLSHRSIGAMTEMATTAVLQVLRGHTPVGIVNPAVLKG